MIFMENVENGKNVDTHFLLQRKNVDTHFLLQKDLKGRGRAGGHPPPPAQIRTGATNAYGSYLGYLASNLTCGKG